MDGCHKINVVPRSIQLTQLYDLGWTRKTELRKIQCANHHTTEVANFKSKAVCLLANSAVFKIIWQNS